MAKRTSRPQLPPTPPTENEQRAHNKPPRGAKRKQPDYEETPQKRLRTSAQVQPVPTPPMSDSPYAQRTPLNAVQEAEDGMEIDELEVSQDEDEELYITVTAADGRRIRKRRAHTHWLIAKCGIATEVLDVLDEDPTWSFDELKRRFKLGLTIGLRLDGIAMALGIMLEKRAWKALPRASARVQSAFHECVGYEDEEEP